MADTISDIKGGLLTALRLITQANGFNANIQQVWGAVKPIGQVKPEDCPSLSVVLINVKSKMFDEAEHGWDLFFGVDIYASTKEDSNYEGLLERTLSSIFEDLVTISNSQLIQAEIVRNGLTSINVQEIEVTDFVPEIFGTKGIGYAIIKLTIV